MFAMQNTYNQRLFPEGTPQYFAALEEHNEFAPYESSWRHHDIDYETELSNILQTPPKRKDLHSQNPLRKTPGAEISDQKKINNSNSYKNEADAPIHIFQAMENLKLSIEPIGLFDKGSFSHPSRARASPIPFSDEYSLWGPSPTSNQPESLPMTNSFPPRDQRFNPMNYNPTNSFLNRQTFPLPFPHDASQPNIEQPSYPPFVRPSGGTANPFYMESMHGRPLPMPRPCHPTGQVIQDHRTNSNQVYEQFSGYAPRNGAVRISEGPQQPPIGHRRQASGSESHMKRGPPTPTHKRSASSTSTHEPITHLVKPIPKTEEDISLAPDSPTSNLKFKQFYKEFKQQEKEGYEEARTFALQHLEILPEKVHWKIFLELADLAKRENHISQARGYFKRVNELQPAAAQGWLEFAKMEEECGDLNACTKILTAGLSHCTVNESLMVKCLKHFERMNQIEEARHLLGALKTIPVERTWRTIMEGALLEARQGNIAVARQVFHYLIRCVPYYGPIYQEACRFEEKCEEDEKAFQFVEAGLQENPRYGPLWFSALRLNEKLSKDGDIQTAHETVERAVKSISKELIWKLYYEEAQIEERAGNIAAARESYVKSVSHCPDNLLWKVWMAGARTELNYDNIDIARKLLKRALKEVPQKMKAVVLLECCRLEEYAHRLDKAREILAKAKKYTKHEWKVFLESVLLEIRANKPERAIEEAQHALAVHTGTGRLWAIMIQLKQSFGIQAQMNIFRAALSEVPKSGEVWCEGARIAMRQNNFEAARKYINFAIQFTPQYGDSFIEYFRLEILEKGNNANLQPIKQACVNADPNYGTLWLHCKKNPLDSTHDVIREAIRLLTTPSSACDEVPAETALRVNTVFQNIHQKPKEERRKAIFL